MQIVISLLFSKPAFHSDEPKAKRENRESTQFFLFIFNFLGWCVCVFWGGGGGGVVIEPVASVLGDPLVQLTRQGRR